MTDSIPLPPPEIANAGRIAGLALGALAAILPVVGLAETPLAGILSDPVADRLVKEALGARPELRQAQSTVAADRERVPQAGALPDPTLTVGIQNDGFKAIQIGTMETSFWQVMLTQPFPWPGKRGLREKVAGFDVSRSEAALERARLSTEADVRRSYLDLVRTRDALRLLGRLDILWREAEGLARARYEVGQAPQSDLLRVQLERTRLEQRRCALDADAQADIQNLNRLRGRPLDEPIETSATLASMPAPAASALEAALADAEARSPELAQALAAERQASARVDLARRDRYPDFTVSAGVMPRGGLEPMWTASVGITLPVFSGKGHAVSESRARSEAESAGTDGLRRLLALRTRERLTRLASVAQLDRLYRGGLLVQSQAAVASTEAQYRVGRITFASVLEVLNAYVSDEQGYLETVAEAQRLAIAQREVSLEAAGGGGGPGIPGSVPGAGSVAAAGGASPSGAPAGPGEAAPSGGGMKKGM